MLGLMLEMRRVPYFTFFGLAVSCNPVGQKFIESYKNLPTDILRDPAFSLLHHHNIPSKVYRKSILPLLITAAKGCIPLYWKQTQPPSIAT